MEPGNRSLKALVLVFGNDSEELAHAIEDRAFQMLNYWSNMDSKRQWVWLEGEGRPIINIWSADNTVLSRDAFEGYDFYFLTGDLNSPEVLAVRKAIRHMFIEKEFYITFLLATQGLQTGHIFENECCLSCQENTLINKDMVVDFIHDYCAQNIFPNMISVDFADYGKKIRGNTICLDYVGFDPDTLSLDRRIMPDAKNIFGVIFIEPEHYLPDNISTLIEKLIEPIALDFFITDVAYIGRNRILCLYY